MEEHMEVSMSGTSAQGRHWNWAESSYRVRFAPWGRHSDWREDSNADFMHF